MNARPLIDLLVLLLAMAIIWYGMKVVCRVREARRRLRESNERMHRDGMICIKCGYNMRASPQQCSECGYRPG